MASTTHRVVDAMLLNLSIYQQYCENPAKVVSK